MATTDKTTSIIVTNNADGTIDIKVESELDPKEMDQLGQQVALELREPAVVRVTRALAAEGVELEALECPDGQYLAVTNPNSRYKIANSWESTSTALGKDREEAIANLSTALDGKVLVLGNHQGRPPRSFQIQS